MFKLVKFSYDDLEGARVFESGTLTGWEEYLEDAKDFEYPYQTSYGDYMLLFADFAAFKQCFEVQDITRSDVDTIYRLGLENMGQFPNY